MGPEPIYKEIGAIVRALRRRTDKAQEVLAGQLAISRATLANIETGRQRILVHQLYAIAQALDVRLIELLPAPPDAHSAGNWATLSIEGDLNTQQRKQVANLIGPIGHQPKNRAKGTNANTTKRLARGAGTKAAR